jgi:serine/threonine-protein kinase
MPGRLTPDQWRELEAHLDKLLDARGDQRAHLLDELSGGDAERRTELVRVLAACEREHPLLDRPASERFAALFDDAPLVFPPSLATRYQLVREIGRGGMAIVYLAHDLKHAREVAVKVVRPDLAAAVGRERFLREISIAANLHHPHIVPVYDSGEADGLLYYVMPYEAGLSLRARLVSEGPLPVSQAILILRDVCEALAEAHRHGIVHRDIKPDNVLLTGRHALLADFGVARDTTNRGGASEITRAGLTLGTPAYMAPEQVTGGPIDHRADVYAFGVLAYEILAGEPPFNQHEPHLVLSSHVTDVPVSLSARRPGLPAPLEALVMRCLEKRAEDRWQAASEVLAELEALPVTGETGVTPAPRTGAAGRGEHQRGKLPRAGDRAPEARRADWYGKAAVGAAVAALAALAWMQRPTARPAPTAPLQSVAVLVFQHDTHAEAQSLAINITSALITALGSVPRLDVRSMDAVSPYRSSVLPIDSIGRLLKVRWLVGGAVRRLADNVISSAELTDAPTGRLIDRREMRAPAGDAAVLIVDLVAEVATMLREHVGEQVQLAEWRAGTRSDPAFHAMNLAYKESRDASFLARAGDSVSAWETLRRADSTLARAYTADPRWTEPLIQRARIAQGTADLLFGTGMARDSLTPITDRGIAYAQSALRMRRNESRALEVLGGLLYAKWSRTMGAGSNDTLLAEAERVLVDATSADTTRAEGLNVLSLIQFHRGRIEQARLTLARAHAADPYARERQEVLGRLFTYNFEEGEDEEAANGARNIAAHFGETGLEDSASSSSGVDTTVTVGATAFGQRSAAPPR